MKSLVIYFSRCDENYAVGYITKGNTEVIAEYIEEFTGADLFKCEPVKEYSSNYSECCNEAKKYQNMNARPELKNYLDSIENYDIIYIGGPIYWGELPYEVYSQLDRLDFNKKIIKPFSTHEGSGLGSVVSVLKEKCVGATIKEGIAIKGTEVYKEETKNRIKNWVE